CFCFCLVLFFFVFLCYFFCFGALFFFLVGLRSLLWERVVARQTKGGWEIKGRGKKGPKEGRDGRHQKRGGGGTPKNYLKRRGQDPETVEKSAGGFEEGQQSSGGG
ncbi:hypothetical protein, partial [Pseudomonas syringae group genomosp. 7]|uniref:hypothetical protein n=1 Tax=Pseudomonas syringae group genomosp. 7 TaxID=251699 RepID=UPI00376F776B